MLLSPPPLGPCIPGVGTALSGGMTERRGITLRRFINTIAPQALENPLQVGYRRGGAPSRPVECPSRRVNGVCLAHSVPPQNHMTASDSASIRAACDDMAATGAAALQEGC